HHRKSLVMPHPETWLCDRLRWKELNSHSCAPCRLAVPRRRRVGSTSARTLTCITVLARLRNSGQRQPPDQARTTVSPAAGASVMAQLLWVNVGGRARRRGGPRGARRDLAGSQDFHSAVTGYRGLG